MKQQLLRYCLAMNASALQAGAHSAKAFFAVAGAHAAVDSIPALNPRQFCSVFLLAFGMEILNYLDTHPLDVASGLRPEISARSADSTTPHLP